METRAARGVGRGGRASAEGATGPLLVVRCSEIIERALLGRPATTPLCASLRDWLFPPNHPLEGSSLNLPLPQRLFLMTLAASGAAIATRAQAQALVDEKDAEAAVSGYVSDAKRVHAKKYPKFAAGQNCANGAPCQGKAAGKQVAGAGWCRASAKKA